MKIARVRGEGQIAYQSALAILISSRFLISTFSAHHMVKKGGIFMATSFHHYDSNIQLFRMDTSEISF